MDQRMAQIEQISHFFILRETLPGGAGNQITPGRLQLQDAANLMKLFITGQRRAAKLGYDTFKHRIPSIRFGAASRKTPTYIIERKEGKVKFFRKRRG